MIKRILFISFTIISFCISAQTALSKYEETVSEFKALYNQKKFGDIYRLLSPEFMVEMKEDEFTGFLQKNIYNSFLNLQSTEYLKEEKEYQSFICHFVNGDLLMNLKLNVNNKVDMLQFLPHQSMPRVKVLDYLSDNKKITRLDSLVDKVVTDYMQSPQNCGLSIGIFKDGKDYFYNYGETKRNLKTLATPKTIYEIGSVTKTFCGILLAKAIFEKKVKSTDDIRLYLPKGKYENLELNKKSIQLIHLANHTSGLPRIPDDIEAQNPYDPLNPYKNYNRQMVFNYLERIKPASEPGTVCEYSNIGMALLGIILEKVYNKSFEELMKEKITLPNNMNSTSIQLTEEQTANFASGYNSNGKETPHWDLGDLPAAGALRSTTSDMLIYLKKNMEEKDEALKLSHQSTFNKGSNLAMAWHIIKTKQGNMLIWHNGGTFGFSTFCGFVKEKNCAVVILSNSGTMVDYIALALLKYLQQ